MRTLIYCTAHAETPRVWQTRYRPWLDAILASGINPDQILLVDDGSTTLPGWPDTQLFSGDTPGEGFTVGPRGKILLFHFRNRLGRPDLLNFPGWHRSYIFGALYAEANGFDRIIHIESDAFLLSDKARQFVTTYTDGWAALWSPRYDVPEMAISVTAGRGLRRLAEFARQPYAALIGAIHERAVPFTHIEKGLTGDRYGESPAPIPANADYAAQVPTQRERNYYWWLLDRPARGEPAQSVTLRFGEGGNGLTALDGGWGDPEPQYHWMLGAESILRLPALPGPGDGVLRLGVTPFVRDPKLPRQRLMLDVNGRRVAEYEIPLEAVLGCDLPANILRPSGHNLVRLIHPDVAAPSMIIPGEKDARRLSVSVEWLTFERFL
jgi:hypothetical protein